MKQGLVILVGVFGFTPGTPTLPPAAQAQFRLQHDPQGCLSPDEFALIELSVQASQVTVESARVYFKAHTEPDWYYADMEVRGNGVYTYTASLPKPLPETEEVDYYSMVIGSDLSTAQTREFTVTVSDSCDPDRVGMLPSSGIVLHATVEGQVPIPPGFAPDGIARFITTAGQAVSGPALTAGVGGAGGVASGTVIAIAAGAGGAAAAGLAVANRSANSSDSVGNAPGPGGNAPGSDCTPSLSQVEFTIAQTAWSGTASCRDRNNQQIYQVINNSPCTLQLTSLRRDFNFRCTGSGGSGTNPTQLQVTQVAPNSTQVVRVGPPAGSKWNGFCCGVVPCVDRCSVNDTYVLETNAGSLSAGYSYGIDSTLAPRQCPACPPGGSVAPNSDYF